MNWCDENTGSGWVRFQRFNNLSRSHWGNERISHFDKSQSVWDCQADRVTFFHCARYSECSNHCSKSTCEGCRWPGVRSLLGIYIRNFILCWSTFKQQSSISVRRRNSTFCYQVYNALCTVPCTVYSAMYCVQCRVLCTVPCTVYSAVTSVRWSSLNSPDRRQTW